MRNTIGNVPLRWYDNYDHIGYDLAGQKLVKSVRGDGIDTAIAASDDPTFSRTLYDAYNDEKVILSERDLEMIRRIQAGAYAHPEFNANQDGVDFYSEDKMIHAMGNDLEPKSRFLPSKWERQRILKIATAMEEGRMNTPAKALPALTLETLWAEDTSSLSYNRKGPQHVSAPKMPLPGHAESYNPPEEYLLTEEERLVWEESDPSDRDLNFIPQKFTSLRAVIGYSAFVRERFERCLDLYLCPRVQKQKLNIDPESLIPTLPKPRDLRPYPNTMALVMSGHTGRIRSLAMDPKGQFVLSGSDDCTVRLWELATCRCMDIWRFPSPVVQVAWNPIYHVAAVASGNSVYLLSLTAWQSVDNGATTEAFLESSEDAHIGLTRVGKEWNVSLSSETSTSNIEKVEWTMFSKTTSLRLQVVLKGTVQHLSWHKKGDYFSTVVPSQVSSAVHIHQWSKKSSQSPFSKNVGQVQAVVFHPTKPFLFHATQRHIRIYNLLTQTLVKKLISGVKWISSMDVHPSGDHLVVGSYDRRVCWFDLDLSSSPFKTLKYHTKAIRQVALHPSYPLLASASDDGTVQIFHARVYNDLLKNPLLVPLKILRGHSVSADLGVLSVVFHPTQPWLVSAGADGDIRLFQSMH